MLLKGKILRTDGVIGVFYSEALEEFFESISAGVSTYALFPDHIETELYDISADTLQDIGMDTPPRSALRQRPNEVNLQFLRKPGLGDSGPWPVPDEAIHKWHPPEADGRDKWIEYVGEQGFDESTPPSPPGIIIEAPNKYSNSALKEVITSAKGVAHNAHDQFIRQVEMEFEVEIATDE